MSDTADGDLSPAADDVPDLVPARMVNEFAYCPRLFYLEWVQARFADNADTVDGRFQHRVVDQETGRAPSPAQVADLSEARSVLVSAPDLGLVGRIDLIEGDGNAVIPVDYKRGSPAGTLERTWEPERRQLAVQVLMLRAAGYEVAGAVLYFVETRERVTIDLTEDLLERTRNSLVQLRTVASADQAPPPLVDSPKCPRCSLVGLCLPDEHNLLSSRANRAPRRLSPTAGSARPLYVTEAGSTISARAGRIEVVGRPDRAVNAPPPSRTSVRLLDVSQVNVFGNVQVTTQALRECFAREISVLWFSGGSWLEGVGTGLPSKHIQLRNRQVAAAHHGGLPAARLLVRAKIKNCRILLRRNSRGNVDVAPERLAKLANQAGGADTIATLLGLEGAAARTHFGSFAGMLKTSDIGDFDFAGRNRRPPRDPVNCLLSFTYAMIVKDLVAVCIGVGLDPYLGVYHRPRFGRPALALDLAEEFRPLLGDSIVVGAINNGELRSSHFITRAGGVSLTQEGRRAVLRAYERRLDIEVTHPVFGYRITYRRVLEVQARIMAAWMLGEVPDYAPVTTR